MEKSRPTKNKYEQFCLECLKMYYIYPVLIFFSSKMNLYIGNLDYTIKEQNLRELFEQVGEVSSVKIISDKMTGRSKGFAFVEMPNDEEANNAIQNFHGQPLKNRNITVNEARPRPEGGGGGRDNGGYNNRRSY